MKLVMDSDCLVKLTKAGAKEVIISSIEVHIPHLVKKETVDEVREKGYQDALSIEENINSGGLHVIKPRKKPYSIPVTEGEWDVVSLYLEGGYDFIASDDRRFLRKLGAANIPYMTPSACIVYLYRSRNIGKSEAFDILGRMKAFISQEEYKLSMYYLEEKG